MSFRRTVLVVAVCTGSFVVACGFTDAGALDVSAEGGVGSNADHGGTAGADGASPADGSSGSDGSTSTGVPVCNPPTCALPSAPAGWQLVLLGTSPADPCPTGFDSAEAIESPVAGANACACAACVKTGTNCSTGGIPTSYDSGGGACGTNGAQHQTNNGLCRAQNGQFGTDARVDAPTAVLGTCTSASSPVPANVASQPRRVCSPQTSTCTAAACAAPASMTACLAAPGDVACPSGTKHLVGSDVAVACPACGCSITSATCGGTLAFYPSSNCAGTPVTLDVGVCKATGGASFVSTKWTPVIASEVCATTPAAPTSVTLTGPQTICCP